MAVVIKKTEQVVPITKNQDSESLAPRIAKACQKIQDRFSVGIRDVSEAFNRIATLSTPTIPTGVIKEGKRYLFETVYKSWCHAYFVDHSIGSYYAWEKAMELMSLAVQDSGGREFLMGLAKDNTQDSLLRTRAFKLLAGVSADPQVRTFLLDIASDNGAFYQLRSDAIKSLEKISNEPDVQACLIGLANDNDTPNENRKDAIRQLGSFASDPRVLTCLLGLAKSFNPDLAELVFQYLGTVIGNAKVDAFLMDHVKKGVVEKSDTFLALSSGVYGKNPKVSKILMAIANDSHMSKDARSSAIRLLGQVENDAKVL